MVTTRSSSRRSPCIGRSVSAEFDTSVDSYVSSSEAPSVRGRSLTASTDAAISAKGSPSSEASMNNSISLTLSTEGDSIGSGDERSEADTSADGYVSSGNGPTLHTSSVSSYNDDSAATSGDSTCAGATSVDRVVSESSSAGIQVMAELMLTLNCSTLSIFYRFWMGPLSMRWQPLRFSLHEFEQLTETLLGPHKNFTIKQIIKLLKADREMLGWQKLRLMVRNLEFFFSYPWGRHSFERTLRMIKVGKKVRRQSDITKKLKQRSLVMHGEDIQDFLVRGIAVLPKLKTFHTDNILAVENDASSSCDPSYTHLLPQKEFTYSRCKAIPQYAIDVYEEFIGKVVAR
ncbi:hypothetical protein ARALYDRAFT_317800 [Arabidopsis lyrata subsp. lyrata]|uniref:DUF1985 domain-containing protein n=1 Tax=Arabidopsis lyrata subsp. lyrata TaxID=81972 RepID=D7L8F0_ARALL|nr:hypothetical protein ARALYDRAFT_317800 [Arabidopsis lyrata subsp. lyrata]